jgi:hypothetical protein
LEEFLSWDNRQQVVVAELIRTHVTSAQRPTHLHSQQVGILDVWVVLSDHPKLLRIGPRLNHRLNIPMTEIADNSLMQEEVRRSSIHAILFYSPPALF